jgi:hypothetical protein
MLERGDTARLRWFWWAVARYDESVSMRLYVHFVLFRETLWAHGTPEQWKRWQYDVETARVFGCFAMTELAHSSQLRGTDPSLPLPSHGGRNDARQSWRRGPSTKLRGRNSSYTRPPSPAPSGGLAVPRRFRSRPLCSARHR